MNISVIGIDIAKAVFYLVGINEKGRVIYRVKVKRAQLLKTLANIPVCVVAMEACGSSDYWAKEIGKLGFEVRLLPAQYVKAYLKSNKNARTIWAMLAYGTEFNKQQQSAYALAA